MDNSVRSKKPNMVRETTHTDKEAATRGGRGERRRDGGGELATARDTAECTTTPSCEQHGWGWRWVDPWPCRLSLLASTTPSCERHGWGGWRRVFPWPAVSAC